MNCPTDAKGAVVWFYHNGDLYELKDAYHRRASGIYTHRRRRYLPL